jgi:ankyrin repeat protein
MNRTPLHYAMGLSNEDIITLLLAHDADTTVKDVVCTDLSPFYLLHLFIYSLLDFLFFSLFRLSNFKKKLGGRVQISLVLHVAQTISSLQDKHPSSGPRPVKLCSDQ